MMYVARDVWAGREEMWSEEVDLAVAEKSRVSAMTASKK